MISRTTVTIRRDYRRLAVGIVVLAVALLPLPFLMLHHSKPTPPARDWKIERVPGFGRCVVFSSPSGRIAAWCKP